MHDMPDQPSIYALTLNLIRDHGIDEEHAHKIAQGVLTALTDNTGDYFPGYKIRQEIRDAKIKSAFQGNNYAQPALQFKISERTIRRVVCFK